MTHYILQYHLPFLRVKGLIKFSPFAFTLVSFSDQLLFAFDFLIIVCPNFGEQERALAFASQEAKVPFAFVRTKCDTNLHDDYEAYGTALTDQIKVEYIREGIVGFTLLIC